MNDRDLHGPMCGDRVADAVFAPTESPQVRVLRAGTSQETRGSADPYLRQGEEERLVRIGYQAARSLDRYLRVRVRHPQARRPQLWLGGDGKGW